MEIYSPETTFHLPPTLFSQKREFTIFTSVYRRREEHVSFPFPMFSPTRRIFLFNIAGLVYMEMERVY